MVVDMRLAIAGVVDCWRADLSLVPLIGLELFRDMSVMSLLGLQLLLYLGGYFIDGAPVVVHLLLNELTCQNLGLRRQ